MFVAQAPEMKAACTRASLGVLEAMVRGEAGRVERVLAVAIAAVAFPESRNSVHKLAYSNLDAGEKRDGYVNNEAQRRIGPLN